MSDETHVSPRFSSLTEFFQHPEELITVSELASLGPWRRTQIRSWLYEAERNGLESAVVRPNRRRLFIHSGRFRKWLDDRTETVRRARVEEIAW